MIPSPEEQINRFIHYFDRRDYARMLEILMPDAVWFRQDKRLAGHGDILKALRARSATLYVRHTVSNLFRMTHDDVAASDADIAAADPAPMRGADAQGRHTVYLSHYLAGYTLDDGMTHPLPCTEGHLHKLSWVRTRLVLHEGRWFIQDQHMLPLFVLEHG